MSQFDFITQPGAMNAASDEATVNLDYKNINVLLDIVVTRNSSDLHLQANKPPMLRLDGALVPIAGTPNLSKQECGDLVLSMMKPEQKERFIENKELDFSYALSDRARFRVNAFFERSNMAAALRLIPTTIPTLESLSLPKIMRNFTELSQGLVLITGPTGSGKSTSLASLIDIINTEKSVHIVTVEDPIEYQHNHKSSVIVQREIQTDTDSFANALKSALREDIDVVLVGEMRDLETISTALTIAETGHLVFATLHTNSAAQTIDRIIDVFPPSQQQQIRIQLSSVLQGIVAQRLIPKIGGGRMAVCEVLVVNGATRNLIREAKTFQIDSIIQTGGAAGMQGFDRTLASIVKQGLISYDTAKGYAINLGEFERAIKG